MDNHEEMRLDKKIWSNGITQRETGKTCLFTGSFWSVCTAFLLLRCGTGPSEIRIFKGEGRVAFLDFMACLLGTGVLVSVTQFVEEEFWSLICLRKKGEREENRTRLERLCFTHLCSKYSVYKGSHFLSPNRAYRTDWITLACT
jgi:hypothetical protein